MSKKSLIILIIAIVVVAGVAYWFGRSPRQSGAFVANVEKSSNEIKNNNSETAVDQNTVDISDWKTFSSEDFGVAFKYPSTWDMSTTERDDAVILRKDKDAKFANDIANLYIVNHSFDHGGIGYIKVGESTIKVDGITASIATYNSEYSGVVGLVSIAIFDRSSDEWSIEYTPSVNDNQNDLKILERIVSTIEFIKD